MTSGSESGRSVPVAMDPTKDDRAARLDQRNSQKERSKSVSDETEDKKYAHFAPTTGDDYARGTSSWKPSEPHDSRSVADSFALSWKPSPQQAPRSVPDSFAPSSFNGSNADADSWLAHFQRYTEYRQIPDEDVVAMFPLFLRDSAIDWYETLSRDVKNDLKALRENFRSYFGKSDLDYFFTEESVFTRTQRPKEKAREYIAQMQKLAGRIPGLADDVFLWIILKGLRPQIRASVIQQKGDIKSVADLLQFAKLAESAGPGNDDDAGSDPRMNQLMSEVRAGREEVQQLTARMARMSVAATQSRSPTPDRHPPRVSFQIPNANTQMQHNGGPHAYYRGGQGPRARMRFYNADPGRQFTRSGEGTQSPCDRCGRFHGINRCPATNVSCFNCGRMGHLRARCRSARRGAMGISA